MLMTLCQTGCGTKATHTTVVGSKLCAKCYFRQARRIHDEFDNGTKQYPVSDSNSGILCQMCVQPLALDATRVLIKNKYFCEPCGTDIERSTGVRGQHQTPTPEMCNCVEGRKCVRHRDYMKPVKDQLKPVPYVPDPKKAAQRLDDLQLDAFYAVRKGITPGTGPHCSICKKAGCEHLPSGPPPKKPTGQQLASALRKVSDAARSVGRVIRENTTKLKEVEPDPNLCQVCGRRVHAMKGEDAGGYCQQHQPQGTRQQRTALRGRATQRVGLGGEKSRTQLILHTAEKYADACFKIMSKNPEIGGKDARALYSQVMSHYGAALTQAEREKDMASMRAVTQSREAFVQRVSRVTVDLAEDEAVLPPKAHV